MGSVKITNLLLVVVAALLVLNLAIPAVTTREAPAVAPPPAPDRDLSELKELVRELRVAVRLQADGPVVASERDPEDDLVVRIPGRLADEWGLTADDVRAVVNALAGAGKTMKRARPMSNETAAIATLRNCSSAQAQFQACAKADTDQDGTGEYGAFVELSGTKDVRGNGTVGRLNPPVLSRAFSSPSSRGYVSRSGYNFLIYLPDNSGEGVIADAKGFSRVDSELAETTWCMYAWPDNPGAGQRTFFVNQMGDVTATTSAKYTGTTKPLPGAAFKDGGRYSIIGDAAIGTEGQDGNVWVHVN